MGNLCGQHGAVMRQLGSIYGAVMGLPHPPPPYPAVPPRSASVTPLTPLPVLEGSRVTLRCDVGPAHPAPTIQWERLDGPSDVAIGPELSFQADPSRAGTYRCAATNAAGTARAAPVSVVVRCEGPIGNNGTHRE